MKKKFSIIVVNFFRVTNPYSGASEVSYNFFKNIPIKNKILFQFSEINQNFNKVKTIKVNSKIHKILSINKLANLIINFCKKKTNPIIIIEGASWIGYTFILYNYLKQKINNAKFIYHSHNIEFLLRKKKGNFLITFLSKFFEKFVTKNFDLFTCVSKLDKDLLKKIYKFNAIILRNGIELPKNIEGIKIKIKKFKYIFFCGSIDYHLNFEALNILIKEIMPIVIKLNPKIKLIVSGNNKLPFKNNYLINAGFVKKNEFYNILRGASLFINPMKSGFGSQIKTITALVFGKTIISSKQGVAGIEINKSFKNLFITNNSKKFANLIIKNIDAKKIHKKSSYYYKKKYSMNNITKDFFKKINRLVGKKSILL